MRPSSRREKSSSQSVHPSKEGCRQAKKQPKIRNVAGDADTGLHSCGGSLSDSQINEVPGAPLPHSSFSRRDTSGDHRAAVEWAHRMTAQRRHPMPLSLDIA